MIQDGARWRAVVDVVMNLNFWVLSNAGNFLNCCETMSFSRKTLLHGVNGIIIIIILIVVVVVVTVEEEVVVTVVISVLVWSIISLRI